MQFFGSLICVNMNYIQKAIFFMDSTFSGRRLLAKKVLLERGLVHRKYSMTKRRKLTIIMIIMKTIIIIMMINNNNGVSEV